MNENTALINASGAPPEAVSRYGDERSESFDTIRIGKWETPLFGCFAHLVPNCLMAFWCPCVSLAQISTRLGVSSYGVALLFFVLVVGIQYSMNALMWHETLVYENSTDNTEDPTSSTTYRIYNFGATAAQVLVFSSIQGLRSKIRERFEIPGHWCGDVWISLCCSCCAIAQMATHVKSYTPGNCSFGQPDTLPAYPREAERDAASSNVV